MPLGKRHTCVIDPCGGQVPDQGAPVFLSSQGRLLHCKSAFSFRAGQGTDEIVLEEGDRDLRGAYLAACKVCRAFPRVLPGLRFFSKPESTAFSRGFISSNKFALNLHKTLVNIKKIYIIEEKTCGAYSLYGCVITQNGNQILRRFGKNEENDILASRCRHGIQLCRWFAVSEGRDGGVL